jgi:hypothetical protein
VNGVHYCVSACDDVGIDLNLSQRKDHWGSSWKMLVVASIKINIQKNGKHTTMASRPKNI